MSRLLLATLIVIAGIVAACANGNLLLHVGQADGSGAPPAGCASPTAPDGSVDLSQCSNAYYVAVIL